MASELQVLQDRPGWTVDADVAIFTPGSGGWTVRVMPLRVPGRRSYSRFHTALLDPAGVARRTFQVISAEEAARVAERHLGRATA